MSVNSSNSVGEGERILVVEDEAPMRTVLVRSLKRNGYRVVAVNNGVAALSAVSKEPPNLILLDIMMPKLDGFAFCKEVRQSGMTIPILIITAKGNLHDRIHGLDLGADDYLVKPFHRDELLARIRALLRRAKGMEPGHQELALGEVKVNFLKQQAWRNGKPIHLTAKEFAALRLLWENKGAVISRKQFLETVWGYSSLTETRTVDRHINSLRSKIEPDPENPRWIQTVHALGYRLEAE
jgi:DNA-binding response OmpR family regulator